MSRHASAEQLASLDLDALRSRKAARIRSHVARCIRCTQLSSQVSAVPAVLAGVPYPSLPSSLASQLDTTLASESAQRVASAPATEAGRRDLPERQASRQRDRWQWQMPGLSVLATRLAAAAGAFLVIGLGGYEIATHTGGNANQTAASSTGSAAGAGARQASLGPTVRVGPSDQPIRTVNAATNFTKADLGAQALAAVHTAKLAAPAAPAASGAAAARNYSGTNSPNPASLAGCISGIVGSRPVQLVEMAKFDGKPAIIIITKQTTAHPAEVWAVKAACSASNPEFLAHQTLSRA
jgi:anti-sigma factor ChrR (cupin superfamily)